MKTIIALSHNGQLLPHYANKVEELKRIVTEHLSQQNLEVTHFGYDLAEGCCWASVDDGSEYERKLNEVFDITFLTPWLNDSKPTGDTYRFSFSRNEWNIFLSPTDGGAKLDYFAVQNLNDFPKTADWDDCIVEVQMDAYPQMGHGCSNKVNSIKRV